ncbi:PEP-CTERM sorting domain-containing protein [Zooshikella ganghwensis]|uniref:PEP-CTERM sorting domain-containing protein n=1 Tax=Zooshikella ganghwensis TaxID=202772 RepID=UPI0003FD02B2|nr:PEP-CTERM sorting domain-containing protein [Zooshikella ganghwensis]
MKKSLSNMSIIISAIGFPLVANAVPIETKDVFCDGVKCGTMEIDKYDPYKTMWLAGVEIDGQFVATKTNREYHYIQSINIFDDPTPKKYHDGSALPVPLIDTPPGGYQGDPFDFKPYYDESEFPTFYDKPSTFMLDAKTEADNKLELQFETWLVCLISEKMGDNAKTAKDDAYQVAPLIGWLWGYEIAYNDVGMIGVDELVDFTVTKTNFEWKMHDPSNDWKTALTQKYGNLPNQDWFNVTLAECSDCLDPTPVPAPSSFLLILLGFLGAVISRKHRNNTSLKV